MDAVGADGLAPIAVITAVVGRAAVALAATAYFIIPAIVLGIGWRLTARGLDRLVEPRSS